MDFPNFFTDGPEPWYTVTIGGLQLRCALTKIDGNKIEADWHEQKPTGKSGASYVFKGMKPAGPFKMTLEATEADDFTDLRALYEMMGPAPAQGGGGTAPNTTLPAATNKALGGGTAGGGAGLSATGGGSTSSTSATSTPNPGPRPPTLSVENAFFAWHAITQISMKEWDGPKITATNSIEVVVTVIPSSPPTAAAVGTQGPKAADSGKKDPPDPAVEAIKALAKEAAAV